MEKRILFLILAFALFILLSGIFFTSNVSAIISISPAKMVLDFQPGMEFSTSYYVETEPGNDIKVYATGDLAQYTSFDMQQFTGTGSFTAYVKLPDVIEKPGGHQLYIMAEQVPGKQKGAISTLVAVGSLIIINVPYPGQYLETSSLMVEDVNLGEPVNFKIDVFNLGTDDTVVYGRIDISSSEKKDTLNIENKFLKTRETTTIQSTLDTSKYSPGIYIAEARIYYSDKMIPLSKVFRIGTLFVNITNWTEKLFSNKINKFDIHVRSQWNDNIDDVYGEVKVFNNGNVVTTFKTPSIKLSRWDEGKLEGYLDASLLEPGKYTAEINLYYKDKSTKKMIELTLEKPSTNRTLIIIIIVSAIIVVAIISLIIILYIRKLKRESKKSSRK